jgi:hypothetical protein
VTGEGRHYTARGGQATGNRGVGGAADGHRPRRGHGQHLGTGRPVSAARRRWLKRRGERSGAKRGCWEPGFRASGQSRLMGARV